MADPLPEAELVRRNSLQANVLLVDDDEALCEVVGEMPDSRGRPSKRRNLIRAEALVYALSSQGQ
jgi:hypothetical protein